MVSKHLKHINNLKNLKVENVKALLKDSFIREGAFLEMKENCTPANGEAIDKALAAHSRKPAVTSATNIKEKMIIFLPLCSLCLWRSWRVWRKVKRLY